MVEEYLISLGIKYNYKMGINIKKFFLENVRDYYFIIVFLDWFIVDLLY